MLRIGNEELLIGDWGLGTIPYPQSPIPNPQSPIPKPPLTQKYKKYFKKNNLFFNYNYNIKKNF